MLRALSMICLILFAGSSPSLARQPTPPERASIEATLRADGYITWDEIELDDGDWIVDAARKPGTSGQCEVVIDGATYAIVEADCE